MPINLITKNQAKNEIVKQTCKTFDNFVRIQLDLLLPQSPLLLYFLSSLVAFCFKVWIGLETARRAAHITARSVLAHGKMIRAKLKEKFGKNESAQATEDGNQHAQDDPIPAETSEDIQQEDEDEGTSVSLSLCMSSDVSRRLSALP
jgi:hypothetical protein